LGYTPKYIVVLIEDVVKCPYAPCEPPDGNYVLEQTDHDPCIWDYADDCFTIVFRIFQTYCTFVVYYAAPYWIFFKDDPQPLGTIVFVNQYEYCDDGVIYGKFGSARFTAWSI